MMDKTKRRKYGVLIGITSDKEPPKSAETDDTEDSEGIDVGAEEELAAGRALIKAVASEDAKAVVKAYKRLKAACSYEGEDEEDEESDNE
jgi:hypothetical protein